MKRRPGEHGGVGEVVLVKSVAVIGQNRTVKSSAVCVRLGKIVIIEFMVIDLTVFRTIPLTLITYLTVRMEKKKSDANPVCRKRVASSDR